MVNDNNSGQITTNVGIKSQTFEAVITRKDGKVVNLGTISYAHQNPVLNFVGSRLVQIKTKFLVWYYLKRGKD